MPANMAGKIVWLKQRGDLTERVVIERLAVTPEQIEALDLPRKPIEESEATGTSGVAYNRRVNEWEEEHGAGATELNALEQHPEEFRRIVREALLKYSDPDLETKNRDAAEEWEDKVERRVKNSLRDAGTDDDLDQLQEWIDDFNEAYSALSHVFKRLRDLKGDESALGEWVDAVEDAVDNTGYPVATVPDGDAALPEDPVYDSERSYIENKAQIDRYRAGED